MRGATIMPRHNGLAIGHFTQRATILRRDADGLLAFLGQRRVILDQYAFPRAAALYQAPIELRLHRLVRPRTLIDELL